MSLKVLTYINNSEYHIKIITQVYAIIIFF